MTGYHEFQRRVEVGAGAERFAELRERVLTWGIQRASGIEVTEAPPQVRLGARATLRLRLGPLRIPAPVEVTAVIDVPDRAGFEYRALPGHPEEGIESFVAELAADGSVRFVVTARSRPARWWSRLGAPVSRLLQDRITARYLAAAASAR